MNKPRKHCNSASRSDSSGTARRRVTMAAVCAAIVTAACLIRATSSEPWSIALPDDYRSWTHVKSGLIDDPAHPAFATTGGLHHIYANALAMRGYDEAVFPDGSVLVYDLHELRELADGSVDQGPRRHVDVMVKDARRFASTGGWGYQEFKAGDLKKPALTPRIQSICAACHLKDGRHDHVFSEYRK
ncbi:MAG TPA: cytochrome P460 family protein [Pseudoxanthomonas sp.]|nr:cytochrome P460 family protein [Pseudoxanthomonas sp.]